jgi:Domain of unknown function (DUF4397)
MRPWFGSVMLVLAAFVGGCGEGTIGPTGVEPTEAFGRIRFVNAVPNAAPVNVTVDGVPMGVNLIYGPATSTATSATVYNAAYGGNRRFVVTRTADQTVTVLDAEVAITADTSQTIYATTQGATNNFFVTLDNLQLPSGSQVKIRAVNLAPGMGNVDVYVTAPNADITALTPQFANVAPRAATDYLTLARATYQVRFTTAGTKTVRLSATVTPPAGTAPFIRTVVALDPVTGTTPISAVYNDR